MLATQASHVSKVTNELKKKSTLSCVNHTLLALLNPDEVDVVIRLADEAEVNEIGAMCSARKILGGSGMRLITAAARSWHMSLGGVRMRIKRLMRQTICFSKSIQMYDIVIGLFVNWYEFGLTL